MPSLARLESHLLATILPITEAPAMLPRIRFRFHDGCGGIEDQDLIMCDIEEWEGSDESRDATWDVARVGRQVFALRAPASLRQHRGAGAVSGAAADRGLLPGD